MKTASAHPERPQPRAAFALVLIIACAMAVAAAWAIRVPVFEEPDEMAHADYAFMLFDVGAPFHAKRPHLTISATKQTSYLSDAVGYRAMRYNPYARVSPQYGTVRYFERLDASAPQRSRRGPKANAAVPYVAAMYPVGYYAIEAAVMIATFALSTGSLLAAFFAARLANVALLGITLFAANVIFRRCGLGRGTAALAVAAVGFFPLVSSVAGYIQPDNLVAALFAIAIAIALPGRDAARDDGRVRAFVTVGCVLAACVLTKLHYALALWLAVVPALAFRMRRSHRFRDAATFFVACFVLPALTYHYSTTLLNPVGHLVSPAAWAATAGVHHPTLASGLASIERSGLHTFADAFFGGVAFQGFWYHFGMRSGTVFPASALALVNGILVTLTVAVLGFFLFVQAKISVRIARVALRRSIVTAGRLYARAVPLNAYVAVTTMLVAIGAVTNGGLVLQGRYWLPVMIPLAVVLFVQLPKFSRAGARRRARFALVASAATYSIAGALFGLFAIQSNFYDAPSRTPASDSIADVEHATVTGRTVSDVDALTLRANQSVRLDGYAVDMMTGLPPQVVVLAIDGRDRATNSTFYADPHLATVFDDEKLLRSRFTFTLRGSAVRPGRHVIRFYVTDRKATYRLAIRRSISLRIL